MAHSVRVRNRNWSYLAPVLISVMYVILCLLLYDFYKLTMLYMYTCTYLSLISMTNKSGLAFFLSIKYMSICLSG